MFRESTGQAVISALLAGGMAAASYVEWLGPRLHGMPFAALWLSHAVFLFVPFKGYLDQEERGIQLQRELKETQRLRDEERSAWKKAEAGG